MNKQTNPRVCPFPYDGKYLRRIFFNITWMYQHVFAKNDFQCLADLILVYLIKYLISKQCHPSTHPHIHISTRFCTVHSENEM